jgi:hypothetical protein
MSDFKVKMKVVYSNEDMELETEHPTILVDKQEIEQFKKENLDWMDWTEEDILTEIASCKLGWYEHYQVLNIKRGFNYGL